MLWDPNGDTARVRVLAALIASLYLPPGANFASIQPAGTKLLVSGYANPGSGCVWLSVDPRTLAFRRSAGSCTGQPRSGHRFSPVLVPNPRSRWQAVRVAGRIVLRYPDGSDTRPLWAYGPGTLWLYDVSTRRGPELLRFSTTTGRLKQRLAMPKLYRPVVAANADGLWLAAAVNGGVSGQYPAALYHVAPGARTAVVVHREGRAALWIAAHGHTVWAELVSGRRTAALWRFDGRAAKPRRLWRHRIAAATAATYGGGSLWGVAPNRDGCRTERVVRIDPRTGRETRLANVPVLDDCGGLVLEPDALTFYRGALYFLDVPRLYRVRP
jgi:hypothetical protein